MVTHRPAVVALFALASCATGTKQEPAEASPPDVASFAEVPIGKLTPPQATALCQEDQRRTDTCMAVGMGARTAAECSALVDSCREATSAGANPTCDSFSVDPANPCAASVGEYLECVDAWNELFVCENAGRWLDPPAACIPVLERCPHLSTVFRQTTRTAPPCDPSSERPPRNPDDDVHGFDGCRPAPSRFVVLGDSIAACSFLPDGLPCAARVVYGHVKTSASPDLELVWRAQGGSFFDQLPVQAALVEGGPGHVFVWIFMIGNDLAERKVDFPGWEVAWGRTVEHFTDTSRFPDGVTFLLNTQYSPYDQCPVPVTGRSSITLEEEELLQDVNQRLFIDVAIARSDTVAIDHYGAWLGHGANANVRGCPHCGADNTSWMLDRSHPNVIGNEHIAGAWNAVVDRMLDDCE